MRGMANPLVTATFGVWTVINAVAASYVTGFPFFVAMLNAMVGFSVVWSDVEDIFRHSDDE
jgi:hypothetical protein